jgi:hypothetical protein
LTHNSDQAKYGSLSNRLVSQFSMQNNQYPKTCTTATDILSNHRFDNRGNLSKKKWNNRPKKDKDENSSGKTTNKTNATSFAQGGKDKTCYCCGKAGHLSPECPTKPRSTIKKRTRLTITKKNNKKKVTMKAIKAQQAKPHPKLDGVA